MSEPDPVESLLEASAPRPVPPDAVRGRVLAAVEREWHRRKRRRWRLPVALAAGVLTAVAAGVLTTRPDQPVRLEVTDTTGLLVDGVLHSGAADLTLDGEAALEAVGPTRLVTGRDMEIRLRTGTRLTWLEADAVALDAGSIYVDTRNRGHLRVRTSLGVVSDLGTRFMVTLYDGGMEVALREGAAAIDTGLGSYTARVRDREGDVVIVSRERIVARAEPASAERWEWIHEVHPGYSRRQVLALLEAIADDLGLGLEFETPAVQAAALQGRLEGDISGLGPEEALEVVLATSGLVGAQPSAGRLVIGFQSVTN